MPPVTCRLVAALLVVAAPLTAQRADQLSRNARQFVSVAEPVVALTGVAVIDGTGAAARPGQTIVIRDGRIAAVGPDGSTAVPAGARTIALPGHTVIPGIVGMHNHTFYTTARRSIQANFSMPRLYLASGVTTARTTGRRAMAPSPGVCLTMRIR